MLEIIIVLAIASLLLAKRKPVRRRRFNLREVRIAGSTAPGALASLDVISSAMTAVATDTYRLITIKMSYAWNDTAAAIDDGAQFGVSHSDYTDAEVEECLEASTAIDLGDKVAQERANRLVRQIGLFGGAATAAAGQQFNDGRPVKTKLNWKMGIGDQLNLWVRNSSGTVWSAGSALVFNGSIWIQQ